MNKVILVNLLTALIITFFLKSCIAQSKLMTADSFIIRDTTLVLAKEHCRSSAITCWFGDNVHLNRMIEYNGKSFWKNYPSMLFHFSGLDLRNYQEKNKIDYGYFQEIENLLDADMNNDSNLIKLTNKNKQRPKSQTDTLLFKLYQVTFTYVYIKESNEYLPNLFNTKNSSSWIYHPANIYYVTKISGIKPYNHLSIKDRMIAVKK